jgi:hypothetical protein
MSAIWRRSGIGASCPRRRTARHRGDRATASRARRRRRARARKHVAGIGRARRRFDHAPVVEGSGWVCGKSEAHRRRALEKRRPSEERTGAETALRPRFFSATVFAVDSGIDRLIARTGRPRDQSPPLTPTHAGVFRDRPFSAGNTPPASARAFFGVSPGVFVPSATVCAARDRRGAARTETNGGRPKRARDICDARAHRGRALVSDSRSRGARVASRGFPPPPSLGDRSAAVKHGHRAFAMLLEEEEDAGRG